MPVLRGRYAFVIARSSSANASDSISAHLGEREHRSWPEVSEAYVRPATRASTGTARRPIGRGYLRAHRHTNRPLHNAPTLRRATISVAILDNGRRPGKRGRFVGF